MRSGNYYLFETDSEEEEEEEEKKEEEPPKKSAFQVSHMIHISCIFFNTVNTIWFFCLFVFFIAMYIYVHCEKAPNYGYNPCGSVALRSCRHFVFSAFNNVSLFVRPLTANFLHGSMEPQ